MFDIEGAKIRIQKRRLELGYSRRYVADQMGVSPNSVVKWDDLKNISWKFSDNRPPCRAVRSP